MEHLDGLRLVALRIAEEPVELLARLFLVGGGAGTGEALCARLRRNERGQIGELLGLECDQLACVACRAPTADWLDDTSASVSLRVVSRFCTTPAWTLSASW